METKAIETEIYRPPGSVTLDNQDINFQVRLGLQGMPGTGKTHASTTFKDPLFISFNRGLASHVGRQDIIEVPFWDGAFCDKIEKRAGLQMPPARKDALVKWLQANAGKLTTRQTVIFDGSNDIEFEYHRWWHQNKENYITQSGDIDGFKEWRLKIDYFGEIMSYIKEIKSDVIYIIHESPDRNEKGILNGYVRPLLTGQYQDTLVGNFSDWYRCHSFAKPANPEAVTKCKEFFTKSMGYPVTDATLAEWIKSTPEDHHAFYLWQTQSDNIFKAKCSLIGAPKFILANYKTFNQYKRKAPNASN